MNVLAELVATARRRAATMVVPPRVPAAPRASFGEALAGKERLAVIAEFKRSSPSQGGIAPGACVATRVRGYADAGAAALSILTEPSRFGGSTDDLRDAASAVALPLLMKDFVIEPVQIEVGAALGASAVLLIARCLEQTQLLELAAVCARHQVTPLVECHTAAEVERALAVDAAVIGVNNRDLDTLQIDLRRAPELLRAVPAERITVAESGYRDIADLAAIRGRVDAVLVGTSLMESGDATSFIAGANRG